MPGGGTLCGQRYDLKTMEQRVKAPKGRVAQAALILTKAQVMALEKAKTEQEAYGGFESKHLDYCGAQGTLYVGNMKGDVYRRQTSMRFSEPIWLWTART